MDFEKLARLSSRWKKASFQKYESSILKLRSTNYTEWVGRLRSGFELEIKLINRELN